MATGTPRRPPVQDHYLKPNDKEWSPPVVIWIGTSAQRIPAEGGGETQPLAAFAVRQDIRRHRKRAGETAWRDGTTGAQLAAAIDGLSRGHRTIWAYSMNLDYDLRLTRMIHHLVALGWEVTGHAIGSKTPWVTLKQGSRCHLTLCDAPPLFRHNLREIAPGLVPDEPAAAAALTPDDHAEKCRAVIRALAAEVGTVMTWWDRTRCGKWGVTMSLCGHNMHRHRFMTPQTIHIGTDGGADEDRKAIYGGARGIARWGKQDGGPFYYLDFTSAYPHIAATRNLPHGRLHRFTSAELDDPAIDSPDRGMIALCRIRTDQARYPQRIDGRIVYTTGEFDTVLASPEIAEAKRLGHLVAIGPGRYHRLGSEYRAWGSWCISAAKDDGHGASAPVRRFAKHAGRAVIGKTAQHDYKVTTTWEQPDVSWHQVRGTDKRTGHAIVRTVLEGAGEEVVEEGDGQNAYPAILAFVESHVRLRLMRAVHDVAGDSAVAWDTDGFYTTDPDILPAVNKVTTPLRMREKPKDRALTMNIRAAQMIFTDARNKTSGIPGNTQWLPDGTGKGLVLQAMSGQGAEGKEETVTIQQVEYKEPSVSEYGWVLANGRVVPFTRMIGPDGWPLIRPWEQESEHRAGYRLAGVQPAAAMRVAHICQAGGACFSSCPVPGHTARPAGVPDPADGPWLTRGQAWARGVSGLPPAPPQPGQPGWVPSAPARRRRRRPLLAWRRRSAAGRDRQQLTA